MIHLLCLFHEAQFADCERKPGRSTLNQQEQNLHQIFRLLYIVNWDGKMLPEIYGLGQVDRLPVLVSEDGMDKLLGVPRERRNPRLSMIFWNSGM